MQHLGLCSRSYLETESKDREQRPTKKSELHRCLLSVSPTHRRQTPTLDTDKSMLRGKLRSDFFQPFDRHTGIKTILKCGWFWRIKKPSNEMMFSNRKRQSHVTWKRKNETRKSRVLQHKWLSSFQSKLNSSDIPLAFFLNPITNKIF